MLALALGPDGDGDNSEHSSVLDISIDEDVQYPAWLLERLVAALVAFQLMGVEFNKSAVRFFLRPEDVTGRNLVYILAYLNEIMQWHIDDEENLNEMFRSVVNPFEQSLEEKGQKTLLITAELQNERGSLKAVLETLHRGALVVQHIGMYQIQRDMATSTVHFTVNGPTDYPEKFRSLRDYARHLLLDNARVVSVEVIPIRVVAGE